MKKLLFASLVILFALYSCSKKGSSPSGGANTMSATIDGTNEAFNNIVFAKNISSGGGNHLIVSGASGTTSTIDVFSITISGDIPLTAGTYDFGLSGGGSAQPGMSYQQAGAANLYEEDFTADHAMSITITSITTTGVQGTFSGKLKLISGTGAATRTITNGKFNVVFK